MGWAEVHVARVPAGQMECARQGLTAVSSLLQAGFDEACEHWPLNQQSSRLCMGHCTHGSHCLQADNSRPCVSVRVTHACGTSPSRRHAEPQAMQQQQQIPVPVDPTRARRNAQPLCVLDAFQACISSAQVPSIRSLRRSPAAPVVADASSSCASWSPSQGCLLRCWALEGLCGRAGRAWVLSTAARQPRVAAWTPAASACGPASASAGSGWGLVACCQTACTQKPAESGGWSAACRAGIEG